MAKRSRRERRQESEKRRTTMPSAPEALEVTAPQISSTLAEQSAPVSAGPNRKAINFPQEYYYVYAELKNIIIITILMFALMGVLSFVI